MAVSKLIFRVDDQAHKIISCESFVSVGEKFDVIIEGGKTENWQGKTVHLTFSQTASMADDVLEVISGIASEMSGSIQIATDAMLKNKRTLNYVSKWGNRGASVRVGLKTDDTDYGATKTKVFSNRANDGTPLPEFQKDVDKHNKDPEAHADIRQAITEGDAGVERRTKEYAQTLVSQERNDRNAEIQRAINEQGISSLPDLVNGAAASAKAAADGALAASKMADVTANSLIESKKVKSDVSGMRDSVADTEKRVDSKYESIEALTKSAIDSAMKAGSSAGQAKESESKSKKNADSASKSALDATSERGEAIRIANEAKAIAEGSTKAFVFDSEMDMQRFVAKQVALPESQRVVKVGSNLLIKQKGVPDYWWTGVNPWIEELESKGEQKIVVDDVPTMGSNNPVSSNGVYTEFNNAKTGITPLVERAENAATAADASTKASAASEDSAAQSAKSAEASAQTASERATVADNSATAAKKSAESAKTSAESASSEVAKVPAMLAGKQDKLHSDWISAWQYETDPKNGKNDINIAAYEFYYSRMLKNIGYYPGLIDVEKYGCAYCFALENVSSGYADKVDSFAFFHCSGLKKYSVGNFRGSSIGGCAFADCTNCEFEISKSSNVVEIGAYAFIRCGSIGWSTLRKLLSRLRNITPATYHVYSPNQRESTFEGVRFFDDGKSDTGNFKIPFLKNGGYSRMFLGTSGLNSVEVAEGPEYLYATFADSRIGTVRLPASLTSGSSIFDRANVKDVYFNKTEEEGMATKGWPFGAPSTVKWHFTDTPAGASVIYP